MLTVRIALALLLVAVLLIWLQRFIEFGQSPHYQAFRSIAFNLVVIMPFVMMVWLGQRWSLVMRHHSGVAWWAYLVFSGVFSVCIYVLMINPILFLLGFSSSPFNPQLIEKYLTGAAALHVSVYWLVLIMST